MAFRFEQIQKQTQRLIMSPQMQQAMHLLQLPMMELTTLIRQEMETNPVLEESIDEVQPNVQQETPTEDERKNEEMDFENEFMRLADLDDEWREYYQQAGSFTRISDDKQRQRDYYQESIVDPETLEEHLREQLHLAISSEEDITLGEAIIGNLDENGYLRGDVEELAKQNEYSNENVLKVLKIIQNFHPVGVGARDIVECLLLQLTRLGKDQSLESEIVLHYLGDLAKKNVAHIAKSLNASVIDIKKALVVISTLEPKPGRMFDNERPQYVSPDVVVEKINDDYVVLLNDDRMPHIRINKLYKSLMKDKQTSRDTRDYIRDKVQGAKWLLKNIQQRQQTVFNVATSIVEVQRDFFENGIMQLRPLTMQDIAKKVGIHESTVSRAIANKYIETPRGLFQMKFFFTSAVKTDSGQDVSALNVKETLSEIVKGENTAKPLSDQGIVGRLKEKGIPIARRTVTKYRKELNIPPSHMRKSF